MKPQDYTTMYRLLKEPGTNSDVKREVSLLLNTFDTVQYRQWAGRSIAYPRYQG